MTSPPAGGGASVNSSPLASRVPAVTSPRWLIHCLCQQKVSCWETCQCGIKNNDGNTGRGGGEVPATAERKGNWSAKWSQFPQGTCWGGPSNTAAVTSSQRERGKTSGEKSTRGGGPRQTSLCFSKQQGESTGSGQLLYPPAKSFRCS